MSASLPTERGLTAATWTSQTAYVAGGANCCEGEHVFDDILRYEPIPGPPRAVAATPSGADGEVRVTWQPPRSNTYTPPLEAYRVERAPVHGSFALVGVVENGRTFVDQADRPGAYSYRITAVTEAGAGDPSSASPTVAVIGTRP